MIGDEYFQLRARLSAELQALSEAIRDLGGDREAQAITDNLLASLKEPFVFVVVGEVNVGKSTFLNALFGHDFSQTGVMPTTEKILFFKHGPAAQAVPLTQTLVEVQVPCEFLRDFHIVDTPGTNSIESEHQEITERFVPVSDLVIFVFSAMNPWGASAWQFLDKVHKHWMRNVIFVLQQCDLRTSEEVQVITDYMRQLSQQRYGQEFPLFAVSGQRAFRARLLEDAEGLAASGFPPLEAHISTLVGRNTARLNKLASTVRLARQLLAGLQEQTVREARQASRTAAVLQEFLVEREMQVDRTLKKVLPALDATERDYQESCVRVAGLADDALALRQAFRRPPAEQEERRSESLDHRLFQDILQRNGDRWRQVGIILEEDYLQYDRFLHAQGRGSLFPADEPLPAQADPEIRRLFAAHVDSTLRRFVLALNLDEVIEPGRAKARRRARWLPRLLIVLLAGAAVAGYFEGPLGVALAAGAGLLLAAAAVLLTHLALHEARVRLVQRLEQSSETLREMLANQVRTDVEALFARFLPLLAPAREQAGRHEQFASARTERLQALEQSLAAFHAELPA